MEQFEDDGTWVWVAFDPEHKVVLAHVVGERKQPSANKLLKWVKERIAGIPSFCSDGLKFYTDAILKFYGHIVSFPKTGLRGRPKVPAMVPDDGLSYAQVIKHQQNGHLVEVEKRQIFGRVCWPCQHIHDVHRTVQPDHPPGEQTPDPENAGFLQENIPSGCPHDVLLRQLQLLPPSWFAEASGCLRKDAQMDAHARAGNHRSELEHERASDFSLS